MILNIHKMQTSMSEITCVVESNDKVLVFRADNVLEILSSCFKSNYKIKLNVNTNIKIVKGIVQEKDMLLVSTASKDVFVLNMITFDMQKLPSISGIVTPSVFYTNDSLVNDKNKLLYCFKTMIKDIYYIDAHYFVVLDDYITVLNNNYIVVKDLNIANAMIVTVNENDINEIAIASSNTLYFVKNYIVVDKVSIEPISSCVWYNNILLVGSTSRYQAYSIENSKIVHKSNQTTHVNDINGFVLLGNHLFSYGKDGLLVRISLTSDFAYSVKRIFERKLVKNAKNKWMIIHSNKIEFYSKGHIQSGLDVNLSNNGKTLVERLIMTEFDTNCYKLKHLLSFTANNYISHGDLHIDGKYFAFTTFNNLQFICSLYYIDIDCVKLVNKFTDIVKVYFIDDFLLFVKKYCIELYNFEKLEIIDSINIIHPGNIYKLRENTFGINKEIYTIDNGKITLVKCLEHNIISGFDEMVIYNSDQNTISMNIQTDCITILPHDYDIVINNNYVANDRFLFDIEGNLRYDLNATIENGFIINDEIVIVQSDWGTQIRKDRGIYYKEKYSNK